MMNLFVFGMMVILGYYMYLTNKYPDNVVAYPD